MIKFIISILLGATSFTAILFCFGTEKSFYAYFIKGIVFGIIAVLIPKIFNKKQKP